VLSPEQNDRVNVVSFRLGAQHFGIPVEQVERVFPVVEIMPLDGAPEPVRGFVTIEGTVTAVVDLRGRVADRWSALRLEQRLILARSPAHCFAFLADDVAGVTSLAATALSPASAPVYDGFIYTNVCDVTALLSAQQAAQLATALQQCRS
jgi:chemotaxis signal transduction protein